MGSPKAEKIGTCIGCGAKFKLAGKKVPDHERSTSWADRVCPGGGRMAKETYDERRERARAKREAHVASRVDEASVMLDALIVGNPELDAQLVGLRKTAMTKYRLQHPNGNAHHEGFTLAKRTDGKRDVYCVFCGDHVAVWPVDAYVSPSLGDLHREAYAHTDRCAMQYLAGMVVAVAPGTRKVPAQLRIDDDENLISFEEARVA